MKCTLITLEDIAEYKNLSLALYKAAKGKRKRDAVQSFLQHSEANLNQLATDILNQQLPYGRFRTFYIHDPKQRLIHAACFEDRVFHHALMNQAGRVFESAMVDNSYACRPNKGVHKAVKQVQKHLRAYAYYGKIDISAYFTAIDHALMLAVLLRKFKGNAIEQQFARVLDSYHTTQGQGLPIGSLTSQYFANYYLDGLDRLLNEEQTVRASIRYMDDVVWWADDQQTVKRILQRVREYLWQQRRLLIKPSIQLQKSQQGITYCGYRISQGSMRLTRRRKRRYQQRRLYWEQQYQQGFIDDLQLQAAYAAVHSMTAGTESRQWRRENLLRHPSIEV